MKIRKGVVVGAALLASLAFVAGCQGSKSPSSSGTSTTTTAPAKPASEELIDAVKKVNSTNYSFSMKVAETTMTGAADPAKKAMKMKMQVSAQGANLTIDVVAVGTDYYLKMAGMPIPGVDASKYMHLDATKVTSLKNFGIEDLNDPTNTAELTRQFVNVEKTGEGKFKGTMDLTKATALDDDIKALGDKAKAVPFEATVDSQGRLTTLKFTVPAGTSTPEMPMEMTYSDFGGSVTVAKPAASEVVEAPASIYAMFNG